MSQSEPAPPARRSPISIAAGTVIVHDQRVLLVRNIRGVTRGRYLLPAGRAEPNEMPDHAAIRETLEETNLHVEITGLLGVRLAVAEDGDQNYFFMFMARLCSPVSDLRFNPTEVDDARFFTAAELDALPSDQTWQGAIAIAHKALRAEVDAWPNQPTLSSRSGVDLTDRWRIWL